MGDSPIGISINPSLNMVYVTNLDSKSLSVIDSIEKEVTETIQLNELVYGLAINPLTNLIYISNLVNNTIIVLDGETKNIITKIEVENMPTTININEV
jgi:YVTN family beta-propeller protein